MTINRQLNGKRVRLVSHTDPYSRLASGALGTIILTDDAGTVHVQWDNGSRLGLVPGQDIWQLVE